MILESHARQQLKEFFALDRWERKPKVAAAWQAVGSANMQALGKLHFGAQLYAAAAYVQAHESDMTDEQTTWAHTVIGVVRPWEKSSDRVVMAHLDHAAIYNSEGAKICRDAKAVCPWCRSIVTGSRGGVFCCSECGGGTETYFEEGGGRDD